MNRRFKKEKTRAKIDPDNSITDPIETIMKQVQTTHYRYFLAHALNGVIWGKVEDNSLAVSSGKFEGFSPALSAKTLLSARLFGEQVEFFLWQDEQKPDNWNSRIIQEGSGDEYDTCDEDVLLWGTNEEPLCEDGFYLLEETDRGLKHAVPIPPNGRRSVSLRIRHYLDYDCFGVVFVRFSRLVDLIVGGKK